MHPQHTVDEVLRLVAQGLNDCQISRATGISTTTVGRWRSHGPPNQLARAKSCPRCGGRELDESAYAYLLGLYLGDGHIVRLPRSYRLTIVQDDRYPHLITLITRGIQRVRGSDGSVRLRQRRGCVEIGAYWRHWPCLFPQHGPGVKHQRTIRLVTWQRLIVERYPRQLVRGLIHSDGCRCVNRVRNGKYAYPRYFFTNTSEDILQIFRDACDAIGVAHRNSKPTSISIARREGRRRPGCVHRSKELTRPYTE